MLPRPPFVFTSSSVFLLVFYRRVLHKSKIAEIDLSYSRMEFFEMSYTILQIDPMRLLHSDPTMLIGCHAQSILHINLVLDIN